MTDASLAAAPGSELLIVTGMSGAGRSTVANALEDLGWYVVDNLPPQMLDPLLKIIQGSASEFPRLAVVMDLRGRQLFTQIEAKVTALKEAGVPVRIIFLEASNDVLVRRFEQVRRPHPLQGNGTIIDGIGQERTRLAGIREQADFVVDTSEMNIHALSTRIGELFNIEGAARLRVTVMSFGFKYGIPTDADMVADMRFLPNPFWIDSLKHQTGADQAVHDYVMSAAGATEFLTSYTAAVKVALAGFKRENKNHVLIAIGCTGGKHRSVAMTLELAEQLKDFPDTAVSVKHRDLGKE